MKKSVFYISSIAFAMMIVLSNYAVQIPINDWLTYGALTYPLTFLLTDVLSEKYGKKDVLKVVQLGVVLAFVPSIMASELRIAIASVTAFFLIQQFDVHLFHYLKERFAKLWWLRNNLSTMVSQMFDTAIFYFIAFLFVMPVGMIVKLIIGDYLIKLAMALLDTPAFYLFAIKLQGRAAKIAG